MASPILTHAALVYSFGSICCTSLSAPLASDSSLRVSDFLEEKSESGNSNCLSKPLTLNCLPKFIVLTLFEKAVGFSCTCKLLQALYIVDPTETFSNAKALRTKRNKNNYKKSIEIFHINLHF